jgi:hypothetical protein
VLALSIAWAVSHLVGAIVGGGAGTTAGVEILCSLLATLAIYFISSLLGATSTHACPIMLHGFVATGSCTQAARHYVSNGTALALSPIGRVSTSSCIFFHRLNGYATVNNLGNHAFGIWIRLGTSTCCHFCCICINVVVGTREIKNLPHPGGDTQCPRSSHSYHARLTYN